MIPHGRTGTQMKVATAEAQNSNTTMLAGLINFCEENCDHLLSAQILDSAEWFGCYILMSAFVNKALCQQGNAKLPSARRESQIVRQ